MVNLNQLVVHSKPKVGDIKEFINNCEDSLDRFTYFKHRSFEIINSHIATVLISNKSQTIGYGHLEKENNKIWLGIMIKSQSKGKGYGKYLMNYLLSQYNIIIDSLPLYLTVHVSNCQAISLFEKVGFQKQYLINNNMKYMMKYQNR